MSAWEPLGWRHDAERILLVPRSACVEYAASSVAKVLELLVDEFRAISLGSGIAVFDIHDVIREDVVKVFACQAGADAESEKLARTLDVGVEVGVDLVRRLRGQPHADTVDALGDILRVRVKQNLLYLLDDLFHIGVCLPHEQDALFGQQDDDEGESNRHACGLVGV